MMKNAFTKSIAPFALMAALMLTSCGNSDLYLKRPSNTNLEFWITQKVKDNELEEKGCQYFNWRFGPGAFLDSKYSFVEVDGVQELPEAYVIYEALKYPDICKGSRAITRIDITDPEITVYGLTINSTEKEISDVMLPLAKSISFVMTTTDGCYPRYSVKNCEFSFAPNKIIIQANTTNSCGIVY